MKYRQPTVTALVITVLLRAGFLAEAPLLPPARRAAFLRLVDRPRVPLAPQSRARPEVGSYAPEHFTFQSEASERVTGILVKSAASHGRRPTRALLQRTGGT